MAIKDAANSILEEFAWAAKRLVDAAQVVTATDFKEMFDAICLDEDNDRLAGRAVKLTALMPIRTGRKPDKADFLAAFQHELFGEDNKRGRRRVNVPTPYVRRRTD